MGGVNLYQAVNLFEGNTVTGGVDVKLYGGNAHRNPETEIYADHVRLHEVAGYLLAQQRLGRFMMEAGLRLERHKLYGTEWVPQAGVSYKPAERTSLKFSFSKGFRSPNMRELYMNFFPGGPSNPDLKPERSRSYDFTVSQGLLDDRMSAELTLFHTEGDNMIAVTPVDGVNKNMNTGRFANRGIEFAMNYAILDNLGLNANYSWLDMDKAIAGAPRNKFYAGATYSPGRFTLGAGAQVVDKLWLVTGEAPRTTGFTLIDVRVAWRPLKWMEFFVRGDNLLGKRYETMAGYPMPGAIFTAGVSLKL
jgi:iron complex outermembrane receptor protein